MNITFNSFSMTPKCEYRVSVENGNMIFLFDDGTKIIVPGKVPDINNDTVIPTVTVSKGTVEYRLPNGDLHNEDGPALIDPDGYQAYYINGKFHRADGPARIWPDGNQAYYINGKLHRTDGPAVVGVDGFKAYYANGKRHRTDGPAVIGKDGYVEYWVDGREYTKKEMEQKKYEI